MQHPTVRRATVHQDTVRQDIVRAGTLQASATESGLAPAGALRASSFRRIRTALTAGLFTLAGSLLTAGAIPQPALSQATTALPADQGSKGAQVYCFMRKAGNNHEVSWTAAYALIRRQSASLFKTSPQHGAVMITEAVVNNPDAFPDCGQYLGALFGSENPAPAAPAVTSSGPVPIQGGMTREERYNN
ncbi:DUF6554 family protein [Synechococcus sp. L2F]|uniref:DUF6554 family protein n=1 Tax=Synechococcus sp. L2F TaxID=2823739 RepID=UPI0037D9946F